MRTVTLALLLILPVPALAMDTSLDRPVSRSEAQAPAKAPKAQPTDERPASAKPASDTGVETATCRDGKTYYHPTGEHRGACAKHGGVASWADGSPVKSRKASGASYR